jgi:hypothetical protein
MFVVAPTAEEYMLAAIKRGDLQAAWGNAISMAVVPLDSALKLTIFMAEQEFPSYERIARRWLVRFIREHEPTIKQVMKAADALNEIQVFIQREEARAALLDLADQIRRRDITGWKPKGFP